MSQSTLFLYTVRYEARDGTALDVFGNQYWLEAERLIAKGVSKSRDVYDALGPRSEIPIERIVIEVHR